MKLLNATAFLVVMTCWLIFTGYFLLKKHKTGQKAIVRDSSAILGIFLQALAFVLVWLFNRSPYSSFIGVSADINRLIVIGAMLLTIVSLWLTLSSLRQLGRYWSLSARLVQDHDLITTKNYAIFRHPIYVGIMGMLIATCVVNTFWPIALLSIGIYWIGSSIRVGSEERILLKQFDKEYRQYQKNVPTIFYPIYVPSPIEEIQHAISETIQKTYDHKDESDTAKSPDEQPPKSE